MKLTGNPLVIGTSILKMRTRALKRVQTLMGSLGSQNTQPTLKKGGKKTSQTPLCKTHSVSITVAQGFSVDTHSVTRKSKELSFVHPGQNINWHKF